MRSLVFDLYTAVESQLDRTEHAYTDHRLRNSIGCKYRLLCIIHVGLVNKTLPVM